MTTYCVDDRHGRPCPHDGHCPCNDEGCDPTATVEAGSMVDAARVAGWSEEYIADMSRGIERDREWLPR